MSIKLKHASTFSGANVIKKAVLFNRTSRDNVAQTLLSDLEY